MVCVLFEYYIPLLSAQQYTAEGVPFFVNTPSETLRRCLGTPYIANMLQRFPVETQGIVR